MAKAAWEKDAEEFGRRFRFGEWESGLLVARSVQVSSHGGNPSTLRSASSRSGRAIPADFAEAADVNVTTVRRYLKTWNLAAKDGLVPPAEELVPGGTMLNELPEAEEWKVYFNRANPTIHKAEAEAPDVPANSLQNAWHHVQDVVRYIQADRLTPLDREELVPLALRVKAAAEYIIEAASSEDAPVTDWDAALAELDGGA